MFESQLCHALTAEPWTEDSAFLSLGFLTCEKEAAVRRVWSIGARSPEKRPQWRTLWHRRRALELCLEGHRYRNRLRSSLERRPWAASGDVDSMVWGTDPLGVEHP